MNLYSGLTDAALKAEFDSYAAAQKALVLGGEPEVIAGEGRRVQYTRSSGKALDTALREIMAEGACRGLDWAGGEGGAIPVRIG